MTGQLQAATLSTGKDRSILPYLIRVGIESRTLEAVSAVGLHLPLPAALPEPESYR